MRAAACDCLSLFFYITPHYLFSPSYRTSPPTRAEAPPHHKRDTIRSVARVLACLQPSALLVISNNTHQRKEQNTPGSRLFHQVRPCYAQKPSVDRDSQAFASLPPWCASTSGLSSNRASSFPHSPPRGLAAGESTFTSNHSASHALHSHLSSPKRVKPRAFSARKKGAF